MPFSVTVHRTYYSNWLLELLAIHTLNSARRRWRPVTERAVPRQGGGLHAAAASRDGGGGGARGRPWCLTF